MEGLPPAHTDEELTELFSFIDEQRLAKKKEAKARRAISKEKEIERSVTVLFVSTVTFLILAHIFSRERKRLKKFQDFGWKNISSDSIEPSKQETPASLKVLPQRGAYTELEILELLFSSSFLKKNILSQ